MFVFWFCLFHLTSNESVEQGAYEGNSTPPKLGRLSWLSSSWPSSPPAFFFLKWEITINQHVRPESCIAYGIVSQSCCSCLFPTEMGVEIQVFVMRFDSTKPVRYFPATLSPHWVLCTEVLWEVAWLSYTAVVTRGSFPLYSLSWLGPGIYSSPYPLVQSWELEKRMNL